MEEPRKERLALCSTAKVTKILTHGVDNMRRFRVVTDSASSRIEFAPAPRIQLEIRCWEAERRNVVINCKWCAWCG